VTITYNNLPAQTVADQAVINGDQEELTHLWRAGAHVRIAARAT